MLDDDAEVTCTGAAPESGPEYEQVAGRRGAALGALDYSD